MALLCTVGAAGLAFAAANLPWLGVSAYNAPLMAQLGGVAVFAVCAAVFLSAAEVARDPVWLRRVAFLFLILGGAYMVSRLVPELHAGVSVYESAASGSLFWTWLVPLAAGQAVFNARLNPGWRLALAFLVVITFFVALTQSSTWSSGWVPPAAALAVMLCVGMPRLGIAAVLAVAVAVATQWSHFEEFMLAGDNAYSLRTRQEAFSIVMQMVRAHPVLGLGPANYYHHTPLFPIEGWYVKFSSHDNWMDVAAQTGIVGLASFISFFALIAYRGWRTVRAAAPGFPRAYACAAMGGIAGTLVAATLADWVIPFVYNIGINGFRSSVFGWVFLGGLLGLSLAVREQFRVVAAGN